MVEDRDGACGRARIEAIGQANGEQLSAVVQEHVAAGSTVRTDAWSGYQGLPYDGFRARLGAQVAERPRANCRRCTG